MRDQWEETGQGSHLCVCCSLLADHAMMEQKEKHSTTEHKEKTIEMGTKNIFVKTYTVS